MSFGVCTIDHGYGVVLMRGTPGGRQRASGSSLLRSPLCFLYTASAAGSIGTSTPEPTMSTFCRIAFGCQLPDRSGWPSAIRGVGPAGGQSDAPPRPPRPWAAATFEINRIAATATTENVKPLAINFIPSLLDSKVYQGAGSIRSTVPSASVPPNRFSVAT